jgi:heat-inducible transcriptional repressor
MDATTRALSVVSHQLGVMLAPRMLNGVFRHIHIFEIEKNRYMLHLTVDAGFVKTMMVEMLCAIDPECLDEVCRVINERFYGLTLQKIVDLGDDFFTDLQSIDLGIIRLFIPSIKKMLAYSNDNMVHADGTANIMLQPEFVDRDKMGAVIEMLGEEKMLMHLFEENDYNSGKVVISIGGENRNGVFESFSVLKTGYTVGSLQGALGIIGPKRMPYPLLVSAVDYTAKVLGELHSQK